MEAWKRELEAFDWKKLPPELILRILRENWIYSGAGMANAHAATRKVLGVLTASTPFDFCELCF